MTTTLDDLPLVASGTVREMYDLGERLLMVASDRISTYDVVHPTPIPDKGSVLTGLSVFWFEQTDSIVPNHLVSATDGVPDEARGRALSVMKLEMLPVECVVRGYLSGSGWKEYKQSQSVCKLPLPPGLVESDKLPELIFTPATKAEDGEHDINISFEEMCDRVGEVLAMRLRDLSIDIYRKGAEYARERGIIIADTKFEFGQIGDQLILIDEVLTPDSSRFWPVELYEPGKGQPSFDKQFVRDWLETTGWDKESTPPEMPPEIVTRTREKYIEAYHKLVDTRFPWE